MRHNIPLVYVVNNNCAWGMIKHAQGISLGEDCGTCSYLGMRHNEKMVEGSSFYHHALDTSGRPMVQHLGFLVKDVGIRDRKLNSTGTCVWVRGRLKTGAITTDFVYMDPNEDDGLIMEFISWKLFGRRLKPGPAIAHTIGRLQKWTGRRCLSL